MEHADAAYVGVRYAPDSRRARRGHVESYFLKANDPRSRRAIWLKATIYAPPARPAPRGARAAPPAAIAEAWAIAFDGDRAHVAVKSSVPFAQAHFSPDVLDVRVDAMTLRADETRGQVASGGRAIAWDLRIRNDVAPLVHFAAPWMYEAPLPSSKLVTPYPDLRVDGSIVVNGESWNVDSWRGALGHNWGPRHAPLYAWGHCNMWTLESGDAPAPEDLVFEGVSGRMKLGPLLSPITSLLCVRYRGVRYDLNTARDLLKNRATISPRRWTFSGRGPTVRIEGELSAETDDFVGLFYANPDGTMTHCLNSKLARARIAIEAQGRPPFTVTSRAAALEIGTMDPSHGVRMYV